MKIPSKRMTTKFRGYLSLGVLIFLQLRTTKGNIPGQPVPDATSQNTSPAKNQLLLWAASSTTPVRATNAEGIPVPSLTATQAIGSRGEALLQDFNLLEKLAAFNRERVPERPAHAKGAGAHGHFLLTHDISRYTKAAFLNGIGKRTPIFVRFSTTAGELGSADTVVDAHGFALKFYTEQGNHDIVGNVIEVFQIRDPMLFPDILHSRKRNPRTHLKDPNMWWDFVSRRPESTHHTLQLFSDIGRVDGFRRVNGSSVHAFRFVNRNQKVVFAKFKFISHQRSKPLTYQEALQLTATNPDYFIQDLYDSIEKGSFPVWSVYLQVMTLEQAKNWPYNPFDITRSWRVEDLPLIPVGTFVLDRNPENYFAEVEQSGFNPGNMVPGIEPSPDRMLAGRIFAYGDSLRYRLGVNHNQLPINKPVSPLNTYNRDGSACFENGGASPNYFPNSFGGAVADPAMRQVAFHVDGIVDRNDVPEDEFFQARLFLQKDVGAEERKRMVQAISLKLKDASQQVRERVLANNFYPVSTAFGDEIRLAVAKLLAK